MKFLKNRSVAVVGYGEIPSMKESASTALDLGAHAMRLALESAGLTLQDVDGFSMNTPLSEAGDPFWVNLAAETLGITARWAQNCDMGGASAVLALARAAAAIETGQCEVVLCLLADAPSTRYLGRQGGHRVALADPSGWAGPTTSFGLLSNLYAERYGWPVEALSRLVLQQRQNALGNPNACKALQKPLAPQDYEKSRLIADPMRLLDCVMRCDGANAIVLCSTDYAQKRGIKKRVHPIAYRELTNPNAGRYDVDLLESGFTQVGKAALQDAGLQCSDIRLAQFYDDFSVAVLWQLEEIGFCARGDAGKFLLGHDISPSGDFPLNTGGGQLSGGQCGLAGGGVGLVEAIRQMFGEAEGRQVADPGVAMVTGLGFIPYAGNWGTSSVLILEKASA